MALTNKYRTFNDAILDLHPDLKKAIKPNDHYPELDHILRNRCGNIPAGSSNTKVIVNHGEIVERVFKTPNGHIISLFSKPLNVIHGQVA
tara:strand:- start:625 stop:894 length:270 start_codon:yes stop_codon:yes gene_type:complete